MLSDTLFPFTAVVGRGPCADYDTLWARGSPCSQSQQYVAFRIVSHSRAALTPLQLPFLSWGNDWVIRGNASASGEMGTAYVLAPTLKLVWGLLGMGKQMNQLPTPAIWSCPEKYIISVHKRARSPSVMGTEGGGSLWRHTEGVLLFQWTLSDLRRVSRLQVMQLPWCALCPSSVFMAVGLGWVLERGKRPTGGWHPELCYGSCDILMSQWNG